MPFGKSAANESRFMVKWIGHLFLFVIFIKPVCSQNLNRAKETIQKLSSKRMAGRGVLGNGQIRSARYLKKVFESAGLLPLQNSYFQSFFYQQNVFPKRPLLESKKAFQVGIDFLPAPECPPVSGTFKLASKDSVGKREIFRFKKLSQFRNGFSASKSAIQEPDLDLVFTSKLTHSLSEKQGKTPLILLKSTEQLSRDSILKVKVKSNVISAEGRNIWGMVVGKERPDSLLIICAHYDHLGKIGSGTYFPGANDNASGVSMLVELAHYYKANPHRYSILFIAFGGEEAGLIGSRHFVANSPVNLNQIRFVFNIDLFGFGEEGATVVNGSVHEKEFQELVRLNKVGDYLKQIKPRGKAANSDHYPFSEKGIPAFFMYLMGGPGHYHDVWDVPETLSLKGFEGSFKLITSFLNHL